MDLKGNRVRFFIAFVLPIFIAFIFELAFSSIYIERFYNFLENILFAFILLMPFQIFGKNQHKRWYLKLVFLTMVFMLFFETGYYLIFNTKFNESSVFIFSQTNYTEASEFLSFYVDYRVFLLLFMLIGVSLLFFLFLKKQTFPTYFSGNKIKTIICCGGLAIMLLLVSYSRRENLPFIVLKSFYDLERDSYFKNLGDYEDSFGPFKATKPSLQEKDLNEVIVIVIGESTARNHLGLYGYKRNTTPLLDKIKTELILYDNVISPHALTVETLKKALTLNVKDAKGSVVQLLNSAGYKTFWLSNQNPIGLHESFVSKLAKASDETVFLTTARFLNNKIYDENLVLHLEKALSDEAKKKVVFIHLQGTHFDYIYRYPKAYKVFQDIPDSKFQSENANQIINSYDNAVLYNDFVISSFIQVLNKNEQNSALLYFSDHGEEVYDSMEFVGHTDDVGSLPMFQIPFILWQSKEFKNIHGSRFDFKTKRPYMIDDLFHSIADLCNINDEHVELERSVFNPEFKNRKRIILNNKDYDSLLLIERHKQGH